jgi:SAM-dependent methyltransferase
VTRFEDPVFYGERWAQVYDPLHVEYDPDAVDFLAKLADGGKALELGIGTGRVALPLSRAGVRVDGVDVSEPMVDKLRAKPGAEAIEVFFGDMTTISLPDRYQVVYMPFNGIFCAITQETQLACFRNAARHLTETGAFVVECFVPDLARFDRGQRVHILDLSEDALYVEYSLHDPVAQQVKTQIVSFVGGRAELGPLLLRYAWPTELDLMARLAGLQLESRYAGWDRRPFAADSATHVSVYRPQ